MAPVFTRGARSHADSRASTKCGVVPVSTFGLDRLLRNRRGNVAMMYALVAPLLVFAGSRGRLRPGGANSHQTERRGRRRRARHADAVDAAAKLNCRPGRRRVHVQWSDRWHAGRHRQCDAGDGQRHGGRHRAHTQRLSQLLVLGRHYLRSGAHTPTLPVWASRRRARRRRPISTSTSCSTIRHRWRCRRRRRASPRCRI